MAIEEGVIYRITSANSGKALAVIADTTASNGYKVGIADKAQSERQAWVFSKQGAKGYYISPYIASDLALTDPIGDINVLLKPKAGAINQSWEPSLQTDGVAYQFQVEQGNDNRNKLVDMGTSVATQYYRDHQSDQWKLETLDLTAIPALVGTQPMGPTDYNTYINPIGTKKAVMVFIDFPDTRKLRDDRKKAAATPTATAQPAAATTPASTPAAATTTPAASDAPDDETTVPAVAAAPTTANTAATTTTATTPATTTPAPAVTVPYDTTGAADMGKHLLGEADQAETIFKTQSYGKFELDVTVKSDLGWKVLSQNSTAYVDGTWIKVADILNEVKTLFKDDVKFADYAMTLVVQPKEAVELNPGTSYGFSPSYPTLDAIVFGADSYANRYVNLVHEVGHQFGLPDLYPYDDNYKKLSAEFQTAGVQHPVACWSIMADMQHSESFMGWERHKMGWLDANRKLYLPALGATPVRVTLHPLTDSSGLSMVVIPLGDAAGPSKVFVVEIGQPVYGLSRRADGQLVRDGTESATKGVLLYTVDARVAGGAFPVMIIPKKISTSPNDQYGQLFEAPFGDGDTKTYSDTETNVDLKVSITKNADSTYTVTLSKTPTPPPPAPAAATAAPAAAK